LRADGDGLGVHGDAAAVGASGTVSRSALIVVQPHEQGDLVVGQPRQEPQLPQGARWVEPLPSQSLDRNQQLRLAGIGRKGKDSDVVVEIEGRGVHPQRSAKPSPRNVDDLPEPRDQMQPGGDRPAHGLDPQAAGRVEQVGSVQQGEGTDVLRPDLTGPQHQLV
jgi:hypothetical protein